MYRKKRTCYTLPQKCTIEAKIICLIRDYVSHSFYLHVYVWYFYLFTYIIISNNLSQIKKFLLHWNLLIIL